MKSKNFNLNISTLDDKVLYQEICKKIKETDAISFKLLGLVPFVSGAGIVVLWAEAARIPNLALVFAGIFGAVITYFIYRWERRNIQICETFKNYAAEIESRKQNLEQNDVPEGTQDGPYKWLSHQGKPTLAGSLSNKGWGKTEAEIAIYGCTILFWLLLPLLVMIS